MRPEGSTVCSGWGADGGQSLGLHLGGREGACQALGGVGSREEEGRARNENWVRKGH